MNRKSILEYLVDEVYDSKSHRKLLDDIETAKAEINVARSMFNNVDDQDLIEVAIYSENVARKRYDYLLSIAKAKGINVSYDYIIEKNLQIAE
ncbi:MAG: DUF2508 family protein [Clostridium butyricum]|nr:DUF2508 family protein [Clostridium butyricum]